MTPFMCLIEDIMCHLKWNLNSPHHAKYKLKKNNIQYLSIQPGKIKVAYYRSVIV